jgi:16S rRNA (guanine527-N7)-methyltransferase
VSDDWRPEAEERLATGLGRISLSLTPAQQYLLIDYLVLLYRWNRVWNLTAIRSPLEAVERHLLDALGIRHLVSGRGHVLDVGAGAGIPGIPLAILLPGQQFTLVDTVGKKCRFMEHCRIGLDLSNLNVHHARIESLQLDEKPDLILSRAFSDLGTFHRMTGHLAKASTVWLAMKAKLNPHELAAVPENLDTRIIKTDTATQDIERCVVEMKTKNQK